MASASLSPSLSPSMSPSLSPSMSPSRSASLSPSMSASMSPSMSPSASPSPIPAGEVVYTLHKRVRAGKMHIVFATVAFGNGVEAYPAGGVPLDATKMGFYSSIDAVVVLESNADAKLYEYDVSANTIRIFTEARIETSTAATLAVTSLEVIAFGW